MLNAEQIESYLKCKGKTIRFVDRPPLAYDAAFPWSTSVWPFLMHCPNLVRLEGDESEDSQDEMWRLAGSNCPLLEEVTRPDLTPHTMDWLGTHCPRLRRIELWYSSVLFEGLLQTLCKYAPSLEQLRCDYARFTDETITLLASHCRNLITLDVDAEHMNDASIYALTQNCTKLSTLRLSRSTIAGPAIANLASVCKLRKLTLVYMDNVSPEGLDSILENCPELRTFSLRHHAYIGYRFSRMGLTCPQLHELAIVRDRESLPLCIDGLPKRCPDLRKLTITCWGGYGYTRIQAVLACCPNLESLNLAQSVIDDSDADVHRTALSRTAGANAETFIRLYRRGYSYRSACVSIAAIPVCGVHELHG
jgi:hypothetical protein